MTATTALERALEAFNRPPETGREIRIQDATELSSFGVFSNQHLEQITDLPEHVVAGITRKSDKTGGRFNAAALPLILDYRNGYQEHGDRNPVLLCTIVDLGVSPRFLSKLTGIHRNNLARWAAKGRQ